MANKVVRKSDFSHCESYDAFGYSQAQTEHIDKTKSISQLSNQELRALIDRLRDERNAEDLIRSLRRSSGTIDTYENPAKIDTTTPIDQLYHYGILGQKWGVRRFQKEDGTRTPAGKKRDAAREVQKSEDHIKSRSDKKKSPEGLSNEELRKLNERLQLEATFKNLTTEKIQKSESFVKKALRDASGQALTDFTKGVLLGSAKLFVKSISPSFAEAAFNIKEKK